MTRPTMSVSFLLLLVPTTVVWTSLPVGAAAIPAAPFAPWEGIVGFLRTIAHLHENRIESPSNSIEEEDGEPTRKIVYAVEEQVSGVGVESNASVIIYDSLQDGPSPKPGQYHLSTASESASERSKRSSETSELSKDEGSERGTGNLVARPFLIGRKLWYVPLWFGAYLILYITALTVKSIARHRIKYPTLVSDNDLLVKRRNGLLNSNSLTRRVTNAISNGEQRYQKWNM